MEFRRHARVVQRLRAVLFATTALTALALIVVSTQARAQSFQGLGFLPGGNNSSPTAMTADGSVVVGDSNSAGFSNEAFRWTMTSGMVGLGVLPGGTNSLASAVSADGSTVVGQSAFEAFRWTMTSGMVGLGFLPDGNTSSANAVSANGSVVVGSANILNGPTPSGDATEAFRWTQSGGLVGLGFLPGVWDSVAYFVSADGSVVVGQNTFANSGQAFRWTQSGGMIGLGFLPGGNFSSPTAMSADGSVVVGQGNTASVNNAAFRWTQIGGMVNLGVLPGGNYTVANAVSADGSAVVGTSGVPCNTDGPTIPCSFHAFRWTQSGGMIGLGFLPGGTPSSTLNLISVAYAVSADGSVVVGVSNPIGGAFRWTQSTGMQSISALLAASGVNMTGWTLASATGVSADGTVIVGMGTDPSSNQEAWLARFSAQFGNGFITPGVAAQSFAGQAAVAQTGNAVIGGSLSTMSEYATQAHNTQGIRTTPYSVFAYANYDSDPSASGTFGMTVDLPDAMVAGAVVSANYINTNMVYDGSAKMWGGSLGAFIARVPDAGLQWLLGINGTTLSGDINRGYLNGSGQAYSQGSTTANGYGATARIGWSFNNVLPAMQVTPFASYTVSTIHFNGYTETTGVFPAQFNGFNDTAQTVRIGADARYTFAPGKWVWGTLASAHRLNNSETEDITGTLIGLFGVTAPAGPVANDWVEATAGIRWPAWKDGALTASLTASIPANYPTTYQARVGVMQMF